MCEYCEGKEPRPIIFLRDRHASGWSQDVYIDNTPVCSSLVVDSSVLELSIDWPCAYQLLPHVRARPERGNNG